MSEAPEEKSAPGGDSVQRLVLPDEASEFCAQVICCKAAEVNSAKTTITIEALEYEGKPLGNWIVTAVRQNSQYQERNASPD